MVTPLGALLPDYKEEGQDRRKISSMLPVKPQSIKALDLASH